MEDSLTVRLDEVEQELVRLLSLRSDDLQIFSSRQDQLLQSHYHSLTAALQTAQGQLEKLKGGANVLKERKEINERWLERQNLKKFWVYCEEIQRQKINENMGLAGYSNGSYTTGLSTSNNMYGSVANTAPTAVYQTPNTNDSTTNLSETSLTNLCDLSLD
jgi:hypothetical protein